MAANEWFGKFKSRAKSVQETAKNRIGQLSVTIDEKLKEAQEDLRKQRAKAELAKPIAPHLQKWQPSAGNPDGELVNEIKPPPVEESVIQPSSESSQAPTADVEPMTVRHKRKKRLITNNSLSLSSSMSLEHETDANNEQKNESNKRRDDREEDGLRSNDTINQTIDRENMNKYSNELNDKISTVDELVENTTLNTMPQKEESTPTPDLTNYSENNIDLEKQESTSSTTELHQENTSMDKPTDELLPMTNTDNPPIEHSGPENIAINIPIDDLPTTANIDDPSIEPSDPENTPIHVPNDELSTLTNINTSPKAQPDSENIPINTSDDELPAEHSPSKNIPIKIPDDELSALINIDDLPIEHSVLEKIPAKTRDDELPTLTNVDDSATEHSSPNNISMDVTIEELPALTDIDDLPVEHSDPENIQMKTPDDELSTLTNIEESPIEHSDPENILMNTPDNELPTSTNIDDLPTEHFGPENITIKVPNDEITTLTGDEDSPSEHSVPENILMMAPNDESTAFTDINDTSITHPDLKNILMNILDDELPAITDIDSSPENISIKLPNDELTRSTDIDDVLPTHPDTNNILMNIPDDELPTIAGIDFSPESIPIKVPNDELTRSTDIDDVLPTHPDTNNILMNIPDDELPTIVGIDFRPESIPIKVPNDELTRSTDIDDVLPTHPDTNNILMNVPDDKLPTITDIDDSSIDDSGSENMLAKIPDDELPTLKNVEEIPVAHSDSKNFSIFTSDDELPTPPRTGQDSSFGWSSSESNSTNISDDELPTSKRTDATSIEHSKSKDKSPTSTNNEKLQIKHSNTNETYSITSKNKIKTPPNELEDSFDELKIPNIPVHRPPDKPLEESTHLAALRAFISKIEDDDDEDDEPLTTKHDTIIIDKHVNTAPEPLHTPELVTSSATSILNDILEDDPPTETLAQSDSLSYDEPSFNEIIESISAMSFETKPIETKRFSVVNCHSIPPGTKIHHINCSATYIYLCTIDRQIFYAKLNSNNLNDPFKWLQHSDSAERIVASNSNQTIWRLFNKHLYTSNDPIKYPPLGSHWTEIKIDNGQSILSMSINDQCGWYIKDDGTLWLIRTNDQKFESINVACPFKFNTVFCFSEKVGVTTNDGEMLIRVGCTNDCPEGDGWIFIEHTFGPIDNFILLTNDNMIVILDKKHHLWMQQCSSEKGFYEILCNDEFSMSHQRYLISVNSELLCLTDCEEQIHIFSDCLTGVQWTVIEKNTRFQRLIGAFPNEDYVWAVTTDRMISSSSGLKLEKPRQAQYLTHATFVPNDSSENTILWSLDESCNIYVRANVENDTPWEQADHSQFEWSRRLINIVCNNAGVWAVDDRGCVHFRHGHISASQHIDSNEIAFLPPAWITIPGEAKRYRSFSQVFCGPADWMVYATDNKQNVYTREGINEENLVGTSWKAIEDCSALELAISEYTLWLLTSHGQVQCRENISVTNPIGTRSTTLPGFFLSLTVSTDDSQVWALNSKRDLLKLDRLTVLFEK